MKNTDNYVENPSAKQDSDRPIFRVQGAGFSIDDETLLEPLDLIITQGESVAIRGMNGSGKTTLLRLLSGRIRPSTGSVHFANHRQIDERDNSVRAAIASLVGTPAYYPDLTVREQLNLVGVTWGILSPDLDRRILEILDKFGISSLSRRFPHELSSGQLQMFHLAIVFMRPFDVILLDEPEQRLDQERKNQLIISIQEELDRGATVVFATHDDLIANSLATRVVSLQASK